MCFAVVTSPNDLKSLRGLYDGIELHTRSLKSLGVNLDLYGELLTSISPDEQASTWVTASSEPTDQ